MSRSDPTSSAIAGYLAQFQRYYPGILGWYAGLEGGLALGRRSMFVAWQGSQVQGLAITKNGHRAKLCHISVSPGARDGGLGVALMRLALRDMLRRGAREIRVTTGEEVFREHASFFVAAGFEVVDWQVHRYRRGASELLWSHRPSCPSIGGPRARVPGGYAEPASGSGVPDVGSEDAAWPLGRAALEVRRTEFRVGRSR